MVKKYEEFLIFILIGVVILSVFGCKSNGIQNSITLSPLELSIEQTKMAYQRQTREAILQLTRPTEVGLDSTISSGCELQEGSMSKPTLESLEFWETPLNPTFTPTDPSSLTSLTPTSQLLTMTPQPTEGLWTNTPTLTKTTTATQVATLTPQTGWGGTWAGYYQQPDGSYKTGDLIITISGNEISGVLEVDGVSMTLTGVIINNGLQASGTYNRAGGSGQFLWRLIEMIVIRGNLDNLSAFCAVRPGNAQPDPCGYFLPN